MTRRNKKVRQAILETLESRMLLTATPALSATGGFGGIGNTGESFPSTNMAVGPNYVVETADPTYAIFNKSTGTKISQANLSTLFSGFATGDVGMFNSQVLYDDQAGRFVIATQVVDGANHKAWVDIAVSNSSDPTQGFSEMHQIEVDEGGTVWSDDGKLGYNADGYVFVGNMAPFTSASTSHSLILTINKSSVLDQNNGTFTDYPVDSYVYGVLVPARMHGATPGGPMWFVSTGPGTGNTARVMRMDNELSLTPTFTSFQLPVSLYTPSYNSVQPAGYVAGLPVNDVLASDCRMLDVEWNNNNLVAAFNGAAGVNLDAAAQWLQFNTSGAAPVVVNQGYVHPADGVGTYYPSIAVDANGDIGLAYQESSATEYISMYVTGRLASDPAGTMETPVRVATGTNTITHRQGDYSGISLDPSSPNTFWAANEYGAGVWSTWIAKFQLTPSSTTNQPPTVASAAGALQNPVIGTTANLSVLGADDGGESNLIYTWATTGTLPAAVTFSANGSNAAKNTTAAFTKAGTYNFQVTITDSGGLSTTSSVAVTVNQTLTSIRVSPGSTNLNENQTQQFSALANDQFGNALLTQPAFTWGLIGPGVLSTAGLYTAPGAAGTSTIGAASGAFSGSASVVVNNAVPTVATPASASPNPVTGATANLSALGADDGGESNLAYTWATNGTPPAPVSFSANGTNAAKNTTVAFTKAGMYNFQVTITDSGGLSTTSSVAVTVNQTLTSISVSPATASLNENQTQQFTAVASDQFGNALLIQPAFSWGLIGPGVLSTTGLYTAPSAAGSATVTALSGAISGSASVAVNNAVPTVAMPASASPNPVTGTTASLSVLSADDGGESNLTYTWATTGTPPAAVSFSVNGSNTAKNTTTTFAQAGVYSFLVTITDSGGLSATSSVTVTVNQALTAPTIATAANASTNPVTGTTTVLSVLGADAAGESGLTYSWSVLSAPAGATSPTFSANSTNAAKNTTATFYQAGDYAFQVTLTDAAGLTATSTAGVTVIQTLSGVSVTPGSVTVFDGATRQFTATAVDQFGDVLASQPTFSWSLGGMGTLDASGLYTAPASGTGAATVSANVATAVSSTGAATPAAVAATPTSGAAAITVTPLPAALNLAAAAVSSSKVQLSWTYKATNQSGYKLLRSTNGGAAWSQIASLSATATGYADTRVSAGGNYVYEVQAYNGSGSLGYSNQAAVTLAPKAPSNLVAKVISCSQINLTWADVTGEAGFQIERSVDGINWTIAGTTAAKVLSFQDSGLNPSTLYYYRVRAANAGGNSSPCTAVKATTLAVPPAAPSNLIAVGISATQVNLSWADNSANESGFRIFRSSNGGQSWSQIAQLSSNVTAYADTRASAGISYVYRVVAYNSGGNSADSNWAQITTP